MPRLLALALLITLAGCSLSPFKTGEPDTSTVSRPRPTDGGAGPVLSSGAEIGSPTGEGVIDAPPPMSLPRERPRTAPATLSPATRSLVTQAQAQRKKGDLPGASVSLDRALRIEPNNPLLWIEMGRLRMDQGNFPQAENMGRKALAMSVGDEGTQSVAWQLIGESLRARGKNPQAEDAFSKARALAPQ